MYRKFEAFNMECCDRVTAILIKYIDTVDVLHTKSLAEASLI